MKVIKLLKKSVYTDDGKKRKILWVKEPLYPGDHVELGVEALNPTKHPNASASLWINSKDSLYKEAVKVVKDFNKSVTEAKLKKLESSKSNTNLHKRLVNETRVKLEKINNTSTKSGKAPAKKKSTTKKAPTGTKKKTVGKKSSTKKKTSSKNKKR